MHFTNCLLPKNAEIATFKNLEKLSLSGREM
jgi:hypothetical protein